MNNSNVSEEDQSILTLEPAERQALESFQNYHSALRKRAETLVEQLIAYVGTQVILTYLPTDIDNYIELKRENQNSLGLVILDSLDHNYVQLICDHLVQLMADHNLANNANLADDHILRFDRLAHLYMRIASKHIDSAKHYNPQAIYVDHNYSAAYWRNHCALAKDKLILCATSSQDTADTMGNYPKITLNDLAKALPYAFLDFINEHCDQENLQSYEPQGERDQDPLVATLQLLEAHDRYACPFNQLAQFCVYTWLFFSENGVMVEALGKALAVLNRPNYSALLSMDQGTKAQKKILSKSNIETSLINYDKQCHELMYGRASETIPLKRDLLLSNYQHYYLDEPEDLSTATQADPTLSSTNEANKLTPASAAKKGKSAKNQVVHIELDTKEHALIKQYLASVGNMRAYQDAFADFCFLDWSRTQYLFANSKTKNTKESLYKRTIRLFEEHKQSSTDVLTPEQEERLEVLLKGDAKNATAEEKEELHEILKQHIHIFNESAKIKKEWEKRIFSGQSFNDDDFILSLTKAMINLLPTQGDESIKLNHVTLTLNRTLKKLQETNYQVACYFSLRFGPFLRRICQELNVGGQERFIITYGSEDKAQDSNFDTHPLFNYAKFFEREQSLKPDLKDKSTSVSKENTSYKFFLEPTYEDGEVGERCIIEWKFDVNALGYHLAKDLTTVLDNYCLQAGAFAINSFTVQGGLQKLNLKDKTTFIGVDRCAAGAFFAHKVQGATNISASFELLCDQLRRVLQADPATAAAAAASAAADAAADATAAASSNGAASRGTDSLIAAGSDVAASASAGAGAGTAVGAGAAASAAICLEQYQNNPLGYVELLRTAFKEFESAYFEVLQSYNNCTLSYPLVRMMDDRAALLNYYLLNAPLVAQWHIKGVKELTLALLESFKSVGMAYHEYYQPTYQQLLTHQADRRDSQGQSTESSGIIDYNCALATPLAPQSITNFVLKHERMVKFIVDAFGTDLIINDKDLLKDTFDRELKLSDGLETIFINSSNTTAAKVLVHSQQESGYTLYESPVGLKQEFAMSTVSKGKKNKDETTKLQSEVYTNSALEFIKRHLKTHPILAEQCTIMIYYCGVVHLPLALYNKLLEEKSFAEVKFHLVIVNASLSQSQQIYKTFEDERLNNPAKRDLANYHQRIKVSILAKHDEQVDPVLTSKDHFDKSVAQSQGAFVSYINNVHLLNCTDEQLRNISALNFVADICFMFHVFDSEAIFDFADNSRVFLAQDELNLHKSLISHADQEGVNYVGKFLVSPVLRASEIIDNHALYFLASQDNAAFKKAQEQLSFITQRAGYSKEDYALGLDLERNKQQFAGTQQPSVALPLFELRTNSDRFKKQIVEQVHKYANIVMYFDELLCRSLLEQQGVKIIYHQKLNALAINLLVASNDTSSNILLSLRDLIAALGFADPACQEQIYNELIKDAIAISGNIILRAQLHRKNAYEMMGLVLSKYLVAQAFEYMAHAMNCTLALSKPCFISLDDYASVFGQKEGYLADILALQVFHKQRPATSTSPSAGVGTGVGVGTGAAHSAAVTAPSVIASQGAAAFVAAGAPHAAAIASDGMVGSDDHEYLLVAYVIESKFFSDKEDTSLKKSLKQTRNSVDFLYNAINNTQGKQVLDSKILLASLANMLHYSSGQLSHDQAVNLVEIEHLISSEQVDVLIKGSSMFFAVGSENLLKGMYPGVGVTINPALNKTLNKSLPITQVTICDHALQQLMQHYYQDMLANSQPQMSYMAGNFKDCNDALNYVLEQDNDALFKRYLEDLTEHIIVLSPSDHSSAQGSPVTAQTSAHTAVAATAATATAATTTAATATAATTTAATAGAATATAATTTAATTTAATATAATAGAATAGAATATAANTTAATATAATTTATTATATTAAPASLAAPHHGADATTVDNGNVADTNLAANASSPSATESTAKESDKCDESTSNVAPATSLARDGASGVSKTTLINEASAVVQPEVTIPTVEDHGSQAAPRSNTAGAYIRTTDTEADASGAAGGFDSTSNTTGANSSDNVAVDSTATIASSMGVSAVDTANVGIANTTGAGVAAVVSTYSDTDASAGNNAGAKAIATVGARASESTSVNAGADAKASAASGNSGVDMTRLGKVIGPLTPNLPIHSQEGESSNAVGNMQAKQPVASINQAVREFLSCFPKLDKMIATIQESYQIEQDNDNELLAEQTDKLISGLKYYGFTPELIDSRLTCNGAIFTFKGNENLIPNKITKVREQLLVAKGLDLREARGEVGKVVIYLNLPRQVTVGYLDLFKQRDFHFDYYQYQGLQYRGYNSKFLIGLNEEDGQLVYWDTRAGTPHTLIGGATGSGKSVCLKTLLLDMVLTNLPEELKVCIADPKGGIDFSLFKNLPHIKEYGLVTDKAEALDKLQLFTQIMDDRHSEFKSLNQMLLEADPYCTKQADNIDAYNKICSEHNRGRLPRIFFVMDEFADWFLEEGNFRKNATEYINRLSAMGRAAGIHLILATQRPDAKLMEGSIKAQLQNRICLKTSDSTNSRIILGNDCLYDASKLAQKGNMICRLEKTCTAQGCFITTENMANLMKAIDDDYQERMTATEPTSQAQAQAAADQNQQQAYASAPQAQVTAAQSQTLAASKGRAPQGNSLLDHIKKLWNS